MSDLIDRAEVMKLLDEQCWNGMFTLFRGEHHVNCFRELVKGIPSVENKGEPTYYPPCIDCNKKMDEIRRTYDKLKEIPYVENKGEWIPDHTVFTKCSCCGWYMRTECFKPYRPTSYHFCPNCGASMKGGE